MLEIILNQEFTPDRNELERIALESQQTGEQLDLEIPIYGQLYFTDNKELAHQFLMAAHVGQSIYDACTEIECYVPSSLDAHESAGFLLVPKDANQFVDALLETVAFYLADPEDDGTDSFQASCEAQDLLDEPDSKLRFPELVQHAKDIMALFEDDESDEDESDDEEETGDPKQLNLF